LGGEKMIKGIGCDLCAIERFADRLNDERFVARILSAREQALLRGCAARRAEFFAGRFSAKEAVAKALGTGFDGFSMTDIEILCDEHGAPRAELSGGAKARLAALGAQSIYVSISHEKTHAMAMAVAE
jgi:phosphopantethiene--protein transferase domain